MIFSGITIPNAYWANEFEDEGVAQVQRRSVSGALLVFEQAQPAGRKMTITGAWVTRATLLAIQTKRLQVAQAHSLTLDDGRTFTVFFDRSQSSLDAQLIHGTPAAPELTDTYSITLKLQIISGT